MSNKNNNRLFRKNLNHLTQMVKDDEDDESSSSSNSSLESSNVTSINNNLSSDCKLGVQSLTNAANVTGQLSMSSGAQFICNPDGQLYFQGDLSNYKLPITASAAHNTNALVNSSSSTSPLINSNASGVRMGSEESTRKREMRLLKNREAARECRRKKKEYIKCLENRVAVLENQNKALIDELKTLKELYCQTEGSQNH